MSIFKSLFSKTPELAKQASRSVKNYWDQNKDDLKAQGKDALNTGKEYLSTSYDGATDSATNIYRNLKYSETDLKKMERNIENQGGYYRELNRQNTIHDSIVIGGESLVSLIVSGHIPLEIVNAYEAAYPSLSNSISFEEKVRELDGDALTGFISGVKGKLFEQRYVEYLNDDNLPDGYIAILAESSTQPGWDIAIQGANGEIASVLQAKASDSVFYVQQALEKYPSIDVVTTDEVYSHLVMAGISENIQNSSITNTELIDVLNESVDASELVIDFAPPMFSLAFIAFTSYKDDSLTLYEKAKSAGDRSGKTYLSYLVGGGIAAITNTWWLGVLGSVGSRYLSDSGDRKYETFKKLKEVEVNNQSIIDKLKLELKPV